MGPLFMMVYMIMILLIMWGVYKILPEKYQEKIMEWLEGEN